LYWSAIVQETASCDVSPARRLRLDDAVNGVGLLCSAMVPFGITMSVAMAVMDGVALSRYDMHLQPSHRPVFSDGSQWFSFSRGRN
jgi:hypothetical protein